MNLSFPRRTAHRWACLAVVNERRRLVNEKRTTPYCAAPSVDFDERFLDSDRNDNAEKRGWVETRFYRLRSPAPTPARELVELELSSIESQPRLRAVTTAWVRSLTANLRRIEVTWFLTVWALIPSA